MASVRVVPNRAGIRALTSDPGVVADLQARMGPVLAAAQDNAPVETGTYRDSLAIETAETADGTSVRVVAGVRYGIYVEAETGNLSRALDAVGGSS